MQRNMVQRHWLWGPPPLRLWLAAPMHGPLRQPHQCQVQDVLTCVAAFSEPWRSGCQRKRSKEDTACAEWWPPGPRPHRPPGSGPPLVLSVPGGEKGHHLSLTTRWHNPKAGALLASAQPKRTGDSREPRRSYQTLSLAGLCLQLSLWLLVSVSSSPCGSRVRPLGPARLPAGHNQAHLRASLAPGLWEGAAAGFASGLSGPRAHAQSSSLAISTLSIDSAPPATEPSWPFKGALYHQ